MKKIYFLILVVFSAAVSCKNGAEDNKNEATHYPTYDTNKVEGKNTPDHPAPIRGDTVH
jgi:hypothetical protein